MELNNEERQPCEVWSRVMGYLRPTDSYNIGKKEEFNERRCFTEVPEDNRPVQESKEESVS